ncbi:helix-turn-helix domain-containing protein [Cohnella silvisoli]|uniref:Helix-turn-helix domain-containing protein n=1 Tax=Cohnella silvisoli TaxID=2873699 RepID=A0ABV1KP45_9BACL|nr:AraC family transcriptional regulator [Cohnella silvisoli]MCD9020920.1 helix-turn-helix domain-containing protein [Cohnella silvisoli]
MHNPIHIRSFIGTHDKDWEDDGFYQHEALELSVVLEGRGMFRCPESDYPMEAGQAVLIPPGVPHSFHAVTAIRFGVLLMNHIPLDLRSLFYSLLQGHSPTVIALSPMDKEQFEQLFRQWLRVFSTPLKEPGRTHLAWIQVLLLYLIENSRNDQQALSIHLVADYLREHLTSGVHIADMATLAGLSEEGLRKRFYRIYGMTPKEFHHRCRLSEAKWLLSSTDKDMHTIAMAIGFSQQHSFSAWFKKQERFTPSEWRKQQRIDHSR